MEQITRSDNYIDRRLCVAPMIDWTDRHCRALHRHLSRRTLLYTEMIVAEAIRRGDRARLLDFSPEEHPVALQIGGSDPRALAEAARIGADWEYDEINLNVGCPSDRVQSGEFGACLMRRPELVADCVAAMIDAVGPKGPPVTVKCRLGVDEQEPRETLPVFIDAVAAAGCRVFILHARKAWLQGLSPKENREIPPLDYGFALEMKRRRPDLGIVINGGIASLEAAEDMLKRGFDGVMIGRAAYHEPGAILAAADRRIFGAAEPDADPFAAALSMKPVAMEHIAAGGRLSNVTRHMLGLFTGRPGARRWRQILSEGATRPGAGPELIDKALEAVARG